MQIPWVNESIFVIQCLDQAEVEVVAKRRVLGKWMDVDASEAPREPQFAVLVLPQNVCETWSSSVESPDSEDIADQVQFEIQQHVQGDPQQWIISYRVEMSELHFCAIRKDDEQQLRERVMNMGYSVIACVPAWSDRVLESDIDSLNVSDLDVCQPNRDSRDKSLVLNTILAVSMAILVMLSALQMATFAMGNQLAELEAELRAQDSILARLDQSRAELAKDEQGLEMVQGYVQSPTKVTRLLQAVHSATAADTWLLEMRLTQTPSGYDMALIAASEQRNAAINAMDRLAGVQFERVQLDMTERVSDRETSRFTQLTGRDVYRFTIQSDWP